jgi:hypothetical protein
MAMKRTGRAFSLLELLLALGTMAATLLLVVALGISVAGRNQQVMEAPVGLVTAESVLNQFIYNLQANAPYEVTFFNKATTANYVTDTVTVDRVTFNYAVDLEALTNASTGGQLGGPALGGSNHMMKITVRVTWSMGNGANQGQHQAEISRLMHEDT